MARGRMMAVLLVLSLALMPLRAAAQAPPAAPGALAALFPAETTGYFELQLRPGDDQGPRLERLLRLLTNLAPDDEQMAWVPLIPRIARTLAVGGWAHGDNVGVVAALAADDPGAILSLLTRFHSSSSSGGITPAEPYGDVAVVSLSANGMGYAAAVGSYVLAANDRATLTATIDRVRAGAGAGTGLSGAANYRSATGRLPASRFVTGYLDGAGLASWIDSMQDRMSSGTPPASAVGRPPGTGPAALPSGFPGTAVITPNGSSGAFNPGGMAAPFGMMSAFSRGFGASAPDLPEELSRLRSGSMAFAVTAAPEGMRIAIETPAAWQQTSLPASTAAALRFVAPNALLAVAGNDLNSSMRPALAQMAPSFNEMLPTGLDLQTDVLGWMTGEYGLGLVAPTPGSPGPMASVPQFTALFEVQDPPTVEGRLRNLVRVLASASDMAGYEPIEERQGDVLVRRIELSDDFSLTWGYLGRWLFITTGTSGQVAQASAAGGLPTSPDYARLSRALPSPNVGVYYADLAGAVQLIGTLMGSRFPLNDPDAGRWRDLVGLLGGVAGTTSVARDGWIDSVTVLELHW